MKLGHLTRSPLITTKNQDKKGIIPEKNISDSYFWKKVNDYFEYKNR